LYNHGGITRHFSEAIADATYHYYLINKDKRFIISLLQPMRTIYNEWSDHYDSTKSLYYIQPLKDATEYSVASIDASGGKAGFNGGAAFRPSINSYMYGNARAIEKIASMKGDSAIAKKYRKLAEKLHHNINTDLWNDKKTHFMDRYKVNNQYVKYWHFIRSPELVGYVPWDYNIPPNKLNYTKSWIQIMDSSEFYGKYGLRTVVPSYQYYMRQYRWYDRNKWIKECQWNGPSWPYQTTQVLVGMANVLNNYKHNNIITRSDYLKVLRQYARQHYNGNRLDIYEDYYPDRKGAIVDIPQRSDHYNHSEFNNLIITGLVGLRLRSDDTLEVNPLIPINNHAANPITYFCLQNVVYHGHHVTIMYDNTGKHYGKGAGLSIWVDGQRKVDAAKLGKQLIPIPAPKVKPVPKHAVNKAVNLNLKGFPKASASYTNPPDSLHMGHDGRVWYFSNVRNRWSCYGSGHAKDWYGINFGKRTKINEVDLFFYSNGIKYKTPRRYSVSYWKNGEWHRVLGEKHNPAEPAGNTKNVIDFDPVNTKKIKVTFQNAGHGGHTALVELEAYDK
jgi:hypothetical protein